MTCFLFEKWLAQNNTKVDRLSLQYVMIADMIVAYTEAHLQRTTRIYLLMFCIVNLPS